MLLSHDQHIDNLDPNGRAVLADAAIVLTTPSAAGRLGGVAHGLASPKLLGEALLTLDSAGAARAAQTLDATVVVPVHYEGWAHFTEGAAELRAAFVAAGLAERLHVLPPGRLTELPVPSVRAAGGASEGEA